jgi:hypothetical protein
MARSRGRNPFASLASSARLSGLGALAVLLAAMPQAVRAQEAPPPPPPAATAPAPAAAAPDRITFELKVPQERGGGTISGSAAELESFGEAQVNALLYEQRTLVKLWGQRHTPR